MLSYAEHGKIPAQTQGRPLHPISPGAGTEGKASKLTHRPFCGSVFRNALRGQVDHGIGSSAMGVEVGIPLFDFALPNRFVAAPEITAAAAVLAPTLTEPITQQSMIAYHKLFP